MASLRFVRTVWESLRADSGLEPYLLKNLKIVAACPGKVTFDLEIAKHHTNRLGTLHGGVISSLVDVGGSLAVSSKGLFAAGVSTDLSVTFLQPGGAVGNRLRGETTCDKFGKTLAFTTTRFLTEQDQLVARGSHTKYVAPAWKHEKNNVDEMTS